MIMPDELLTQLKVIVLAARIAPPGYRYYSGRAGISAVLTQPRR